LAIVGRAKPPDCDQLALPLKAVVFQGDGRGPVVPLNSVRYVEQIPGFIELAEFDEDDDDDRDDCENEDEDEGGLPEEPLPLTDDDDDDDDDELDEEPQESGGMLGRKTTSSRTLIFSCDGINRSGVTVTP
jgi:hypothetical protein